MVYFGKQREVTVGMRRPSCRAKSLAGRIHGFARRSVVHIAVASPDMDADSAAFWTETRQGKLLASMEQNLVSYFIRRMHPAPLSQHNATEQGASPVNNFRLLQRQRPSKFRNSSQIQIHSPCLTSRKPIIPALL